MKICKKCNDECKKCTVECYFDQRDKNIASALYIDLTENGMVSTANEIDEAVKTIEQLVTCGALEAVNRHELRYADHRIREIYSVRKLSHPIWNRIWFDTVQAVGFAPKNTAND